MITTLQAFQKIMQYDIPFQTKEMEIHKAYGKILAEDIFSDTDFPPFDRVCMDGIAIQYIDEKVNSFKAIGIQSAGEPSLPLTDKNHCIEIMTGAMLPPYSDTIIPYEHLQKTTLQNTIFFETLQPISLGQHIHKQGIDLKKNDLLLSKNTLIRSIEIGILASIGKTNIRVLEYPKILVVSTGNELVEIDQTPLPYQIRKSNVYAIKAILQSLGIASDIAHIDDDKKNIQSFIAQHKSQYAIIIFSGGISAGKFDFLPEMMKAEGLHIEFHKVAQKPGKPMLFGSFDKSHLVFSLPGNPVSALVCMYRYVLPWLKRNPTQRFISLARYMDINHQLTNFVPVAIKNNKAYPIKNNGSGDFWSLTQAHGFIELSATKNKCVQEEQFPFWEFV